MNRTLQIGVCLVALTVGAGQGLGQTARLQSVDQSKAQHQQRSNKACLSAYKKAQKFQQHGQLVQAKKLLRSCAKAKCGVFLEHQCTFQFARIDSEMPSVVPIATDDSGKAVVDLALKVDGYLLASRLDGHSVLVSPGLHEFSFENGQGVVAKRKLMILQGQHNRRLAVTVGKPEPVAERKAAAWKAETKTESDSDSASDSSGEEEKQAERPAAARAPAQKEEQQADEEEEDEESPPQFVFTPKPKTESLSATKPNKWFNTGSYILLGTGVAGLASYGVFTYWGRQDNEELAACSPNCPQSSIDHIDNLYTIANVSLAVGAASLLGASYLVWKQHSRYTLEVDPAHSGAVATVKGVF